MKISYFIKVRLFFLSLTIACAPMAGHAGTLEVFKTLGLGIALLVQRGEGVLSSAPTPGPTPAPSQAPIEVPTDYPTAAPLCQFNASMLYETKELAMYMSLALRDDHDIIIGYHTRDYYQVALAFCEEATCISPKRVILESLASGMSGISLKINHQGNPVVSYYGSINYIRGLKIAVCQDPYCLQTNISFLDSNTTALEYHSLQINSQNCPVVIYGDAISRTTKIALCDDPNCLSNSVNVVKGSGEGRFVSSQLTEDDLPYISYFDRLSNTLTLAICHTKNCNDTTIITNIDSNATKVMHTSLVLHEGKPLINYGDYGFKDTRIAFCTDPACSEATVTIISNGTAPEGLFSVYLSNNLQINPVTHFPAMVFDDVAAIELRLVLCENPLCTVSSTFRVHRKSRLAVQFKYVNMVFDSSGFPVISYSNPLTMMEMIRCYDHTCFNLIRNPVINTLVNDTTASMDLSLDFQRNTATGHGGVAYHMNNDSLYLATCLDEVCALFNNMKINSGSHSIGDYFALQYNPLGYPIVSYQAQESNGIGITSYDGVPCLHPSPTSKVLAREVRSNLGVYTSIQVRSNGNPVIVYFNDSFLGLNVIICNDPLCDDNEVVFLLAHAYQNRLLLDKEENPVIVYFDPFASTLNVAYCANLYCTASDIFTLFTYSSHDEFSFQLNDMGYPIISYYQYSSGLWLTTCYNRECTPNDATLIEGNYAGRYNDLQLDEKGYAMISYYHDRVNIYRQTKRSLKLAMCRNLLCTHVAILEVDTDLPIFFTSSSIYNTTVFTKLQHNDLGDLMIAYMIESFDGSMPHYFLKVATVILNFPYLGCENKAHTPTNPLEKCATQKDIQFWTGATL